MIRTRKVADACCDSDRDEDDLLCLIEVSTWASEENNSLVNATAEDFAFPALLQLHGDGKRIEGMRARPMLARQESSDIFDPSILPSPRVHTRKKCVFLDSCRKHSLRHKLQNT